MSLMNRLKSHYPEYRLFGFWQSRNSAKRDNYMHEVQVIAKPVIKSAAFKRLKSISFLGILSPRYSRKLQPPFLSKHHDNLFDCDGSRYDHSLGVASIALEMARNLGFSEKAQRYSIAWGLVHDIATWPLSHTGESAFSQITNIHSRELRSKIITGKQELSYLLRIDKQLREIDIDPFVLIKLCNKQKEDLPKELAELSILFSSPLSPDTIEGIQRSGNAFSIPVPESAAICTIINRNVLLEIEIQKEYSNNAIIFWRKKSDIYKKFINHRETISWESSWSLAIKNEFKGISLNDSLFLSEEDIIERVNIDNLPKCPDLCRYKHPMEYIIISTNTPTKGNILIHELHKTLSTREMKIGHKRKNNLKGLK
jgi:hypothetical protein